MNGITFNSSYSGIWANSIPCQVRCQRNGNEVVITGSWALGGSNQASVISLDTIIPSQYRPTSMSPDGTSYFPIIVSRYYQYGIGCVALNSLTGELKIYSTLQLDTPG